MPERALFVVSDSESILERMEPLLADLREEVEPLVVLRYAPSAQRLRALGYPTLLVSDVLNWEQLLPYTRAPREIFGSAVTPQSFDGVALEQVTTFDRRLAEMQRRPRQARAVLVEAGEIVTRFLSLARFWQPRLVFVWNGYALPHSPIKALAKQHGAFTLCAERGLVPDSMVMDTEGVNAGSYLCGPKWEEIAARPLDAEGEQIVADYRQRHAAERRSVIAVGSATAGEDLSRELGVPGGAKVILCPVQLDLDTNPILFSPHFPTNSDVARALVEAGGGRDFYVLLKAHPEDMTDPSRYQELLGDAGRVVGKDVPLHSLMDLTDIVVTRNSTVGFEGLLLGKPAVVLGRSIYSHKGFTRDVTDVGSLRQALEAAATEGLTPEQDEVFRRFLAYFLRRYHYYVRPEGWQRETNQRKLEFIRASLLEARPEWGEATPGETSFWRGLLAVEDELAQLGRRVSLRAAEGGEGPPQRILVVKTCPPGPLGRLVERLRRDLPEVSLSLVLRRPEELPQAILGQFAARYALSNPLQAAGVLARGWDVVIYCLNNVSVPPGPLFNFNRLVRAPTRLLADDVGRLLVIGGSRPWAPTG
ncbi:MAG TPA: hypothetical protein VM221_12160 [Armatimonadota bacterium]|nr:hypothetical protein [Armatimonadota bacterium]